MSVLLGLDVGTSGARALAVDGSGKVLAEASAEYPLHTPHPGWSEQNPEDWWQASEEVLGKAAARERETIRRVFRGVPLTLSGDLHADATAFGIGR